jgi:hypothetical protein
MTSLATAPDQARQRVAVAVSELREAAVAYLRSHDGSADLGELFSALRSTGHADDLISRAVAEMLSTNELHLTTVDRRVVLPSSTP